MQQGSNILTQDAHAIAIEQLRQEGYVSNFEFTKLCSVRCLEDKCELEHHQLTIQLFAHSFDARSTSHQLVFTVDAADGRKGILRLAVPTKLRRCRNSELDLIELFWLSL